MSTGFYDGDSSLDQFKRREQIYSSEFAHRFNDTWAFRSTASYAHSDVDLDQVYQIGWDTSNPNLLNRYYSGSRSSLDAFALDNQLEADFATSEVRHKVVPGAEYHQYKNDLSDASGYASQLNALNGESLDARQSYNFYDSQRRYYQTGVYLQDEMQWQKWHLDTSVAMITLSQRRIITILTPGIAVRTITSAVALRCSMPLIMAFHPMSATARLLRHSLFLGRMAISWSLPHPSSMKPA